MPPLREPTGRWFSKSSKNARRSSQFTVSERLVPLGEIVATHGLEGWLKIQPFNPHSTALDSAREVFIEREGTSCPHQLEENRPHNRQTLIKLYGIDSIDAAKPLIGAHICVTEDSLPPLKPGEYYHFQVIGLEVVDTQGKPIGTVSRTWVVGGREIYVVAGGAKEYLIPAVKEIIEKVDFETGKMIINPPDGLLDL
jgi:16S rRNA processing protein RimM